MSRKVYVAGVGMTAFRKPGAQAGWDYPDMAHEAVTSALSDAGIAYSAVQQACVGYVYGDSTSGQAALYGVGLSGIPIYNINNNCSTGASALFLAKQLIEGGLADCVLALGFEKMSKGSLNLESQGRKNPLERLIQAMTAVRGATGAPMAAQLFGNAGKEHMERYGTSREQIAKIAEKNHRHSVNNPLAQFQEPFSLEKILASPVVHDPLTKLQCCPTSDGAAAAVLCSHNFLKHLGAPADRKKIEIAAMEMTTDFPDSFEKSCIKQVGSEMSRKSAQRVYAKSGLGPENIHVIELHDCFSTNELITYEALGLCTEGKAGRLIDSGAVTYGGKWVVNPSGGLISKGHPLGATGLAQCAELTWQLRGAAAARQVNGATVGLQHNIGLGGAAVVAIYRSV